MKTMSLTEVYNNTVRFTLKEARDLLLTMLSQHKDLQHQSTNEDYACWPVLVGPPGIGKTAMVRQTARAAKQDLWTHHIGSVVQEENLGLPSIEKDKAGNKYVAYAAPEWWPDAAGVFFLDEIFTASEDQQNQIREILSERRCAGLHLPPDVFIIGATNPETAEHLTVRAVDAAVVSRCLFIPIEFNPDDTMDYWASVDALPDILQQFFRVNKTFLLSVEPRRVVAVADVWDRFARTKGSIIKSERVMYDALSCWLGPDIVVQFKKFVAHGDNPRYYPILGKHFLDLKKTDKMHTQHLFLVKEWKDAHEDALLGATTREICRIVVDEATVLEEKQNKWVAQFLDAQNDPEVAAHFMHAINAFECFEKIYAHIESATIADNMEKMFSRLEELEATT